MSNYSRGRAFEYRVGNHLRAKGWTLFRSAGSHGKADLVALRGGEVWLIQCKLDGYMSPTEREALLELARENNCTAVLAHSKSRKLELQMLEVSK